MLKQSIDGPIADIPNASAIALTGSAIIEPRISHAVLLTSAQLSRGLVRLFFVFVVARVLGPQQFGSYALLLAMIEILAVASGSGHADYLTREAAKDARIGWGLGSQLIWLRIASAFLLAGAGLGILRLLGYPRMLLVAAAWLSLTLASRAVSEGIQGVLRGVGRYVSCLVIEWIFDLALVGGVVFLLKEGGGLGVVIAMEVIAASAAAAISIVLGLIFRTSERIRLKRKQVVKQSSIFNVYAFIGNLYDRLDIILLSKLAGDHATGIYSAAYRPLASIQLLPYGVIYSLVPELSRNPAGAEEQKRLERGMGLLLSAAFVLVLATMAFAGPAVTLLLGIRYMESAVALKILIWAVILRYVNYALNVRLLVGGHERVFIATSLVCLGVNFIGNLVFIPTYSWRAAAIITIVTEIVLFAQNIYWLRRIVGVIPKPFRWFRTSLAFAVLLGVLLAGAKVVSPLVVGSMCVVAFLGYLYRAGMFEEFAATWPTRPRASLLSREG